MAPAAALPEGAARKSPSGITARAQRGQHAAAARPSHTETRATYEARAMGAAPQHTPRHLPPTANGSAAAACPKR
eukprot:12207057-Alexandrium_andersonii.AAC.1